MAQRFLASRLGILATLDRIPELDVAGSSSGHTCMQAFVFSPRRPRTDSLTPSGGMRAGCPTIALHSENLRIGEGHAMAVLLPAVEGVSDALTDRILLEGRRRRRGRLPDT